MTVRRLLREMDGDELAHWMAYDLVSPIGDSHSDYLTAMICQIVANRTGGKGENEPFKLVDFFPNFWNPQADNGPTPEQLWRKVGFIHSMLTELNQAKEMRKNAGR